jgi:hypothetical protein
MPKTLPNTNPTPAETKANVITPAILTAIVAKPDAEIEAIARAITPALDEYEAPGLAVNDAADASREAGAKAEGTRERLMKRLAGVADKHGWNNADKLKAGCDQAIAKWSEGKNRLPTTLAQLKVELYRAMHPAARPYIEDAFADAKHAWAEERAAVAAGKAERDAAIAANVKKAELPELPDAPLQKTFAKCYHLVAGNKGILQAHIDVADPKKPVASHDEAADPHMLAETRDRAVRQDPKAAARALAKLVDTVEAIYAEFPAASLQTMANFARALNYKALEEAKIKRDALRNIAAKRAAAPSAAPRRSRNAIDEAASEAADPDNLIGD